MNKSNSGPFLRSSSKKSQNFSVHGPWTGIALLIIAISQVPIALKATVDLVCISKTIDCSALEISRIRRLESST